MTQKYLIMNYETLYYLNKMKRSSSNAILLGKKNIFFLVQVPPAIVGRQHKIVFKIAKKFRTFQ